MCASLLLHVSNFKPTRKVQKMKKLFSLLISILLVLSIAGINQVEASASLPLIQRGGGSTIRFAPKFIRGANRKLRYTIKAKYPQAIGARDERLVKLNQDLKSFIEGEVNAFKKDFQAPEQRTFSMGSSFDSGYAVTLASNDLVSIAFYIDTYFEGAAHGNHNTLVFNYDLSTGKMLKLSDLFKPNSNYLDVISNYAIKALKKELGPDPDSDWIQNGAGPKEENYKSWNISRKGLEVTFDAYQVASYAEGPHEVIIPYSVLKNVIDPAGPLARIVKTATQTSRLKETGIYGVGLGNGIGSGPGLGGGGSGEGVGWGAGSREPGGGGMGGNGGAFDPNRIFGPREVDVKARLLSKPEPQWTAAAKKNSVAGTVIMRVVLSATGEVINIRVVQGLPDGLSESAVAAARQIKFVPAMKNGRAVSQYIQIEYNFNPY